MSYMCKSHVIKVGILYRVSDLYIRRGDSKIVGNEKCSEVHYTV
jgi:hypothetical protein